MQLVKIGDRIINLDAMTDADYQATNIKSELVVSFCAFDNANECTAYTTLHGTEAIALWHYLCNRADDAVFEHDNEQARASSDEREESSWQPDMCICGHPQGAHVQSDTWNTGGKLLPIGTCVAPGCQCTQYQETLPF